VEEKMGRIDDHQSNAPRYHDGQSNTVLAVAEVKTYAVRYTDGEARETMCLVDCFGKMDDEDLGVFIKANEREMTDNLRRPSVPMLQRIRQKIAELGPATSEEMIPDPGIAEALDDVVEDEDHGEEE
jgi:hypothetical protein